MNKITDENIELVIKTIKCKYYKNIPFYLASRKVRLHLCNILKCNVSDFSENDKLTINFLLKEFLDEL